MSLINLFKKKHKYALFTTPSHSQSLALFPKLKQLYKYDISEIDVLNPEEALDKAEKKASEIYKTKSTHFLTNGSTSGIIASVLACTKKGDKVLIWENAHNCHKNAVELAGASPIFYELEKDEDWGIYKKTNTDLIEQIIKKERPKSLIVTSPSYEGITSDIGKLKEICEKYETYLIVDEAHGALYPFCDELPESAIYSGADFVVQSLHKTAGGLNPTALLHVTQKCKIETATTKKALSKITTTSPSYPILASIEKNINYLNSKKGRAKILELIKNIRKLKQDAKNIDIYEENDITKILVKSDKMNGFELSEFLFNNKIEDEKTNEKSTMLLCGIGTDEKKLLRLKHVLKTFLHSSKNKGFTLAEVLITIGIIGIVAALTIPTLIKEKQKSSIISKTQKVYNTFARLVPIINKEQGDFTTIGGAYSIDDLNNFFTEYLASNLKIAKDCGNSPGECWFDSATKDLWKDNYNYLNTRTDSRYIILSDGTSIAMYIGSGGELNIFFGIDGQKGKNTFGKDVFALLIINNTCVPRGNSLTDSQIKTYTESPGSGSGTQYALTRIIRDGWQINYY